MRHALTPTRIGSWRLEYELGRGGMASVHSAYHRKLGGRAAIKLVHDDVLTESYTPATFLREARIARAIDHPGIAEVYATGTHDGRPYLVLERLIGASLGVRLDESPLPRREAMGILLELCSILRVAHAAGIVHRDLKLDNVFLLDTPYDGGRRVKLLDWGVAHVIGEPDPFQGLIAGTLVYVAPELIRGEAVTPAADIYSLAVVAYHLLCRRPPFTATTDLSVIKLHLYAEPPRASVAWDDCPPALDDLLYLMLDKRPEVRPTLDDIERELHAALAPRRRSLVQLLCSMF